MIKIQLDPEIIKRLQQSSELTNKTFDSIVETLLLNCIMSDQLDQLEGEILQDPKDWQDLPNLPPREEQ